MLSVALLLGQASCGGAGSCGSSALISGTVLNDTTGTFVASALIALQKLGSGTAASVPGMATDQYTLAAPVDGQGGFSIPAACGPYSVYAFAPGFVSGGVQTFAGRSVSLGITQNDANALVPTVVDFKAAQDPLTAGATVTFTATLEASASDPLSNQVLLINPILGRVQAFAPPAAASATGAYPNGTWTLSLVAPTSPGVYRYALVAVSGQGLTALKYLTVNVQR